MRVFLNFFLTTAVFFNSNLALSQETKSAEAADSSVEFGAFFDVQATESISDDPAYPGTPESGFLMQDGAVYLKKKMKNLEIFVDLPMAREQTTVYDPNSPTTAVGTTSDNNNLRFAKEKAQLYGAYSVTNSLKLTIGQFDGMFGLEANDSKDRIFSQFSTLSNETLVYTHTGILLDWAWTEGGSLRILAANPGSRGSYGNDSNDRSLESGLSLSYSTGFWRVQVGGVTRKVMNLEAKSDRRTMLDATVGVTLGPVSADFEYTNIKDPRKNQLTADPLDSEKAGDAMMALLTFKISESTTASLRVEKTQNDPGNLGHYSVEGQGFNIKHELNENFFLRAEFISQELKASENADSVRSQKSILSSVFKF